jgi:DegV family protein with EDD domain
MEYITGIDLYQMFNYGTQNILSKRAKLNEINVFPVPDSDTGNNLASTMQAIALRAKEDESFHNALESISESALFGARGNSGVIFAQFINGLRSASKGKDKITIEEFAVMALESVEYTYNSISNPVEGTMLTVIKDWANCLIETVKDQFDNVKNVFEKAFQIAKNSLEMTKEKLLVLKKHNVVDSGAMGFVLFLQGINSYYNNEIIETTTYENLDVEEKTKHDENVKYRYCTEGLVKGSITVDEEKLRSILDGYGDSLIIAKGLNIFRIHIHTDTPELIFKELKNFGQIITQKVDNMIQDIALDNSERNRVILTDSIGDIPKELLHRYDVAYIPININVDEVDYFDKLTINNQILFDLIPKIKEYPTTATPTIKYLEDVYKKLLDRFEEVIAITVSSNLSATGKVFHEAAKKFQDSGKKIHVVDSLNNSVTEGLLILKASQMLQEDKPTEEILEYLDKAKRKTKILVCLNTFKYAVKSGRVPKVVGSIGSFFGMRPIMSLDKEGKGTAFGMAFSKKGITKKIEKLILKEIKDKGIESYGLVHCLNPELVEEYEVKFTNLIGFPPEYITEVSSATAIHSGLGTVAIGYIRK